MNKKLEKEIEQYKTLRDAFRKSGAETRLGAFAEGVIFGAELAETLLGEQAQAIVAPMQRSIPRPPPPPKPAPNSEALPDSGVFDVEPTVPHGFPQTADLAFRMAKGVGIEGAFAADLWTTCHERGWVNTTGKRIVDWQKYLAGCWKNEQQRRLAQATQ